MNSNAVKSFYENNTRRFLAWGGGRDTGVIHREVWGDGVKTKADAFHYTHQLLLHRLRHFKQEPVQVLDLGCGVGSSLFYLCDHFDGLLKGTGVTISPTQVNEAKERAQHHSLSGQCTFIEADFTQLPPLDPVHFAYSIEAFVHAPSAVSYFEQVARILTPGGRLYIIDDLLESDQHNKHLERFKAGWRIGSLYTVAQLEEIAASTGLKLIEDVDLTPFLNLSRPRDLFIKGLVRIPGVLKINAEYMRSLDGGDALQVCLQQGLMRYRLLGFERLG